MLDQRERETFFRMSEVQIITDLARNNCYKVSKVLGEGSFGVCFRVSDSDDNILACKRVSKVHMNRDVGRRFKNESNIQRALRHRHVVEYLNAFEDEDYSYLVMELCGKGSMQQLLQRRLYLVNVEVRYYGLQIVQGLTYLHEHDVIHRDLKLANLLLTDELIVKIADFGLAATAGENVKRYSKCGTPNYIAPEMVDMKGHGREVDVWALGCVLYALLVGGPPFTAHSKEETLHNARNCQYKLSPRLGPPVRELLARIFVCDPSSRPTAAELLHDPYFTEGFLPERLPLVSLRMKPSFYVDLAEQQSQTKVVKLKKSSAVLKSIVGTRKQEDCLQRKFFREITGKENVEPNRQVVKQYEAKDKQTELKLELNTRVFGEARQFLPDCIVCSSYQHVHTLKQVLQDVLSSEQTQPGTSIVPDPGVLCVSRWVDHGEAFCGFAYNLSDSSTGVFYSDCTHLKASADGCDFRYITSRGVSVRFTRESVPSALKDKMQELQFLRRMLSRLSWAVRSDAERAEFVFLVDWRRYDEAVVMFLSSGVLQVNFRVDHTKLVLDPLNMSLTQLDREQSTHHSLTMLHKCGCEPSLRERLGFILLKLDDINLCRAHGDVTHA